MATRKDDSTYSRNEKSIIECDLTYAVNRIGGRWKILILDKLASRTMRFSELKKEIPAITERMLTLQLRTLEQHSLITRIVFAEVPARVEYQLTEIARQIIPLFNQLSTWGRNYRSTTELKDPKSS